MSFANRESFTSFPLWIPNISFSSLISVARTSNTMLNSSGERGIFVLFLILQKKMLSICSPLRIMFAAFGFYYIESYSFYACFLESFDYKWVLNFVTGFLYTYWDNRMVFIFQFVSMVNHIDWFANIEESFYIHLYQFIVTYTHLYQMSKTHLVMIYDFLNLLLDSVW